MALSKSPGDGAASDKDIAELQRELQHIEANNGAFTECEGKRVNLSETFSSTSTSGSAKKYRLSATSKTRLLYETRNMTILVASNTAIWMNVTF